MSNSVRVVFTCRQDQHELERNQMTPQFVGEVMDQRNRIDADAATPSGPPEAHCATHTNPHKYANLQMYSQCSGSGVANLIDRQVEPGQRSWCWPNRTALDRKARLNTRSAHRSRFRVQQEGRNVCTVAHTRPRNKPHKGIILVFCGTEAAGCKTSTRYHQHMLTA